MSVENSNVGKRGRHSVRLEKRRQGSAAILVADGEVDLYSSPQMRATLLTMVEDPEIDRIIVNLGGVSYIDSSGVATLVEGLHKANKKGRKFSLCALSSPARKVIELARLERVFTIHETEELALSCSST